MIKIKLKYDFFIITRLNSVRIQTNYKKFRIQWKTKKILLSTKHRLTCNGIIVFCYKTLN